MVEQLNRMSQAELASKIWGRTGSQQKKNRQAKTKATLNQLSILTNLFRASNKLKKLNIKKNSN